MAVAIDLAEMRLFGYADECTLVVVRPSMERATERVLLPASLLFDDRAPMPADGQESAKHTVGSPRAQDRFADIVGREERTREVGGVFL